MLRKLVQFSVQRRGVVLVVWAGVVVMAALSLRNLSVDAVPDVTNPQVSILTSAPGLSPLEVERYLTQPIERSMSGLPGLQ